VAAPAAVPEFPPEFNTFAPEHDIEIPARTDLRVHEIAAAEFTLEAFERRRVDDQLRLTLNSLEGAQVNNEVLCSHRLPNGAWEGVEVSQSGTNHPGAHGGAVVLSNSLLLKAETDEAVPQPRPGRYLCQILTYVEDGGRTGFHATALRDGTWLRISAANEEGAEGWLGPFCESRGEAPSCVYMNGQVPETWEFNTARGQPTRWTAAPLATNFEVIGTFMVTTCKTGTRSCKPEYQGDGNWTDIRTGVTFDQLYPDGSVCRSHASSEPDYDTVTRILNSTHHYPIPYRVTAPVLDDCGGSRTFALSAKVTRVAGLPLKIDGGRFVAINKVNQPTTLLFYRAGDGVATAGAINGAGDYGNFRAPGTINSLSPNWTHIVPAGGRRILFYRAGDGRAETGMANGAGKYVNLQGIGGLSPGWTHITHTGDGRLLFYRASDGLAVTGAVDADGGFTHLRTLGTLTTGWTHIVPVGNQRLLFYRATDGFASTGVVAGDGRYVNLQNPGGLSPGWTHVTHTGDGLLLFYRAGDGQAVTGLVNADGTFFPVQDLGTFTTGWTHITHAGGGRLLFYRAHDGLGVTGRVERTGGFTNLRGVAALTPGWTQIAAPSTT